MNMVAEVSDTPDTYAPLVVPNERGVRKESGSSCACCPTSAK